jgi:hypothetical protein
MCDSRSPLREGVGGGVKAPPNPARVAPRAPYPTTYGWLIREGGWQVAGFASQLEYLCAQPDVARLLAEVPEAARILHPIRWMLGYAPRESLIHRTPR